MSKKTRAARIVCLCLCFFLFTSACFGAICQQSAKKTADTILSQHPSFSLSQKELIQAIGCIEKYHRSHNQQELFSPEETGVPCIIERCASLGGYLIRELDGKDHVGKGGQKVIRRALLYGALPKIIVDCQGRSVKREIEIFEKVRGCRGIVSFLGSRSQEGHHNVMYLDYFPEGSLEMQIKRRTAFSEQQIIKIALDISCGLKALHNNHFIHRDLYNRNMLIRLMPNNCVTAALADFGHTEHIDKAKKMPPNRTPGGMAPEVLIRPIDSIDRYAAEIYLLGSVFYQFVFKRSIPWKPLFANLSRNMTGNEKEALFAQVVSLYDEAKEQKLGALEQEEGGASFKNFKELIFEMVHYDPQQRPPIDDIVERLDLLHSLLSGDGR